MKNAKFVEEGVEMTLSHADSKVEERESLCRLDTSVPSRSEDSQGDRFILTFAESIESSMDITTSYENSI